jgi:hypothetical protein
MRAPGAPQWGPFCGSSGPDGRYIQEPLRWLPGGATGEEQLVKDLQLLPAKLKIDAGRILEVVLASRIGCPVDPKASQQVVDLNRAKLYVRDDRVIQAAAELHREGIVRAALVRDALVFEDLRKLVTMRGAKERFAEWLELAAMRLELRSEHISNHVCAKLARRKAIVFKCVPHAGALSVELEVSFDPDERCEVVDATHAAAENIEAGDHREVRVNINDGKINGNLELWIARLSP